MPIMSKMPAMSSLRPMSSLAASAYVDVAVPVADTSALDASASRLDALARRALSAVQAVQVSTLVFALATLIAGYWLALPRAERHNPAVVEGLDSLRRRSEQGMWMAVHVLDAKNAQAQRIVEQIVSRPRIDGVKEKIVLVGASAEQLAYAHSRGDDVLAIDAEQLAKRFHVQAGPLLAIVEPSGDVRYLGGYETRGASDAPQDLELIRALIGERAAQELPLLSVIHAELETLLAPLGWNA